MDPQRLLQMAGNQLLLQPHAMINLALALMLLIGICFLTVRSHSQPLTGQQNHHRLLVSVAIGL